MGYVIIIPLITNRKENMYLIISKLEFNISEDSYSVEAQDTDFNIINEKLKALQLLNTQEDKTFFVVDVEWNKRVADAEYQQERANHIAKSMDRGEL